MATWVYLSNETSDVSGYLKAYVGMRPLLASATVSTTNTLTVGSSTSIQMTLTSGGSAAKWITAPLKAVTIAAKPMTNFWADESNAAANAEIRMDACQYTTSLQAAFVQMVYGTELGTTIARVALVTTNTVTSTAFATGDRLAITPYIINNGTMGDARNVIMDYNKNAAGVDGDTYILFDEKIEPNVSQWSNSNVPTVAGGPSLQRLQDLYFYLTQMTGIYWTDNAEMSVVLDELANQRDLQGA